jgi:hypothetical protein
MKHNNTSPKKPVYGIYDSGFRPLRPEEVAPADYGLDLLAEFLTDPVIPATLEIGEDELDGFHVRGTFEGHMELSKVDFIIKLDGKEIDIVTVRFVEPEEEGAFDHLPMGGAVKGLFAALVEHHRRDLDQLRCNMAYLREFGLEPAEMAPGVSAPVPGEGDDQST